MFVFRFFLAVHNCHVQEQILYSPLYENYWSQIFELHHSWSEFRRSKNLKIPFSETSLELFDQSRYSLLLEETKMELSKKGMSYCGESLQWARSSDGDKPLKVEHRDCYRFGPTL